MASQSRSEEEARADFDNLTEQEYEFQDASLLQNVDWKDASERGEMASQLLKNQLDFQEVKVYTNKTKREIIAILTKLK